MGTRMKVGFPYAGGRTIDEKAAASYPELAKIKKSGSIKDQIMAINKRALELVEMDNSRVNLLKDFKLD